MSNGKPRVTLIDDERSGGVIGGKGYNLQAAFIASRVPHWLEDPDFAQFLQEGAGDVDVRFDRPGGDERRYFQVKGERFTLAPTRDVLATFRDVDRGSPNTYTRFTLACAELNRDVKRLRRTVETLRKRGPFYRRGVDAIFDETWAALQGLVEEFGLPVDADFLVAKVNFDTNMAGLTDDELLRDQFVGRLSQLPAWAGIGPDAARRAYEKVALLCHRALGQTVARRELEALIQEAAGEMPVGGAIVAAAPGAGLGELLPFAQPTGAAGILVLAGQPLEQLIAHVAEVSVAVAVELEARREAWREGRVSEAADWLSALRADPARFDALAPAVKADVLRLGALLALELERDTGRARDLASQARALSPTDRDRQIEAHIVFADYGPEAALSSLERYDELGSINLRAALLYEAGRREQGDSLLEVEIRGLQPDAETYRLRALSALAGKDLIRARADIDQALALKPQWESVRLASAIIDYYSGLVPAAFPDRLMGWPEPVPPTLVRQDDTSRESRRRAARILEEIERVDHKDRERLRRVQAWRLACLAIDAGRGDEAARYCEQVLRADLTHCPAIAWAVSRDLDVNLEPCRAALEEKVQAATADTSDVLALAGCYLATGANQQGLVLLERTWPLFEASDEEALWTFWHAQSLIQNGQSRSALTAIDAAPQDATFLHLRATALGALAREPGDWDVVIDHLEICYHDTGDPIFLLDLCSLQAERGRWTHVADRVAELLERIPTGDMLRLAAVALHNTGCYDECLGLLNEHLHLLPGRVLPVDLRRLTASCRWMQGRLGEAVVDLKVVIREAPTTRDFLQLADLYFRKGDLQPIVEVGRQLVRRPDLPAASSLALAEMIRRQDRTLAVSLWERATGPELPPEMVGNLVEQAFRLGLDERVPPLLNRLAEQAPGGVPGLEVASIQEIIALSIHLHERAQHARERYRAGGIPAHVLAEVTNWPLAFHYHATLSDSASAPDLLRQPPLFARHGGRSTPEGFPAETPDWRLHLDITAFLLAAHLGVLDAVETTFAPLHIPPSLTAALHHMQRDIEPAQPALLPCWREIVGLADSGHLDALDTDSVPAMSSEMFPQELGGHRIVLLAQAYATGGYMVDFLPLTRQDGTGREVVVPEEMAGRITDCRGIVEALRRKGPLSQHGHRRALRALGFEGQKKPTVVPQQGRFLYCHANVPVELARIGLLRVVCDRYRVFVEKRELERLRGRLEEYNRRQTLARWVGDLYDRIGRGADVGLYEFLPEQAVEQQPESTPTPPSLSVVCVREILGLAAEPGDVVWVDDRWMNAYGWYGSAPIVTVVEVLKALVGAGALDEHVYYEKLAQLRAANVRYIPLEAGEILYHLGQARVDAGILTETQSLATLRRYVAACLLQAEFLQRPPVSAGVPNRQGELEFVISLTAAVTAALVRLWKEGEGDESDRRARAGWIWDNLYVSLAGLREAFSSVECEGDRRALAAASITDLLAQAAVHFPPGREGDPRCGYLEWLEHRFLYRRFEGDPDLCPAVAGLLAQLLAQQESTFDEEQLPAVRMWHHAFYADLSPTLQSALENVEGFLERIESEVRAVVSVGDLHFDPDVFFAVAAEAMNDRPATVATVEGQELTFEPLEDVESAPGFRLTHPVSGEHIRVVGTSLGLLQESIAEREQFLQRHRYWFDLPREETDRAIADIVNTRDPRRRVEKADEWRESSAAAHLARLYQMAQSEEELSLGALLPPSAGAVLRHLRLSPDVEGGDAFRRALEAAAIDLIGTEGPAAAFERLACLPVALPQTLQQTVTELPAADRRALFRQLVRIAASPLSRIHLMRLLVQCSDGMPAFVRLARHLAIHLVGLEGREEFAAFSALLRWVGGAFSAWPEVQGYPPHLRLAAVWAHADRLFTVFSGLGAQAAWFVDTFGQAAEPLSPEMFASRSTYALDIAHPRRAQRERLLLTGISYAVGDRWNGFVTQELQDLVAQATLVTTEVGTMPAFSLLLDPSLAGNALGSFLSQDAAWAASPFLEAEVTAMWATETLRTSVVRVLDQAAGQELSDWVQLQGVLEDLPAYGEVQKELAAFIRDTEFVRLVEQSQLLGIAALWTASRQAVYLRDEMVRQHLCSQLVEITRYLGGREWKDGTDPPLSLQGREQPVLAYALLFDVALNLAVAEQAGERALEEFAELCSQLVETCPHLMPLCKPLVQALYDQLPVDQAEALWHVMLQLRAG
jgi:tetratricopeptide (TPR) repeat protein